jgi:hypothetical protein
LTTRHFTEESYKKKVTSTVLCFFLVIALASCGDDRENAEAVALGTLSGRYCEAAGGSSLLLSEEEGAICISPADTEDLKPNQIQNLKNLGWEFSFELDTND